jgi:hypothetical protein
VALSSNSTTELTPARVLVRFGVRMSILMMFASFGTIGYGRSLAVLLWMTTILCAMLGTIRRERVFTAGLNHWDEMVAFTALYCGVTAINELGAP